MNVHTSLPKAALALATAVAAASCSASNDASTTTTTTQGASASPVTAMSDPAHVRGTIADVRGDSLTVESAAGSVVLKLTNATGVAGVVPGTRADIKPGTFIGTASTGSGTGHALEVVVFPDSMRGTGEGNYPWDLSPGSDGGGSTMTNGTVGSAAHGSMMTNGTVGSGGSNDSVITVSYKGGSRRIMLSPDIPIVKIVPGSRALLVKGAHVFVIAKGSGASREAARILAGENGTVPPM